MSKARDLADSAQEINILDGKSFLDEDNLASDSATGIASQQSIKAYVDGITTTNITSTGALNSGSITSGFGNINNGSSTITTTGAITGGSFVIGSADINENDLESIDGITAGTVAASKAVVVNANKDITGFRNLTATGTINGTLSGAIASTTTATTQAESDDSTKVATTAYVVDKITTLIGGAPSTLNDLNELAAAINDDANYNSTLTTALATKLPLAGGTMTGNIAHAGNFTLDVGGELILDADTSGTVRLKDGGSQYGTFFTLSSNFYIKSQGNDKDIIFQGNDSSGSGFTALTLDMSDAGTAIFNQKVVANSSSSGDYVRMYGGSGTGKWDIYGNGANLRIGDNENAGSVQFDTNVGIGTSSPSVPLHVNTSGTSIARFVGGNDGNLYITNDSANVVTLQAAGGDALSFNTNGGNERMRIDSSGRLLLGTSTSFADGNSEDLQIAGSGNTGMMIKSGTANYGSIYFGDATSGDARNAGILRYFHNDNSMQFWTSEGERVRIDSNGNLLVGTTDTTPYNNSADSTADNGIALGSSGIFSVAKHNDSPIIANRTGSDGGVIKLHKSGVDRGGIGLNNGDPYISRASGSGMRWYNGAVVPTNDAGNDSNNTMDLGSSSVRFKHGYFSGNLYGDGSNLTGVGGSTAIGAVGTYAFFYNDTGGNITAGNTVSGNASGLKYGNSNGGGGSDVSLGGTWRSMGKGDYFTASLYVRIS